MAEDMKLESMGEGVFQGCSRLKSVTLPTEIKEIPAKTFMGCNEFLRSTAKDFQIGKYVEKIGDGAFAFYDGASDSDVTNSSKVITVHPENEHFTSVVLEAN